MQGWQKTALLSRNHRALHSRLVIVSAARKDSGACRSTSKTSLMKQNKAWLKSELEQRSLPAAGLKAELAERLSLAMAAELGQGMPGK